jgi:hypothetical protein
MNQSHQCSHTGCTSSKRLRRGLCDKHYKRLRRHGNPSTVLGANQHSDRLWDHVQITDTCWLWTGPLNHSGYGANGGKAAHRVVYLRLVGPIAAGMELDHLCRVRHCVRPDHLEPVTHSENVRRAHAARPAVSA